VVSPGVPPAWRGELDDVAVEACRVETDDEPLFGGPGGQVGEALLVAE
jgi:hypothetical protein